MAAGFCGCLKKSTDDPVVSLKTRKARVIGDWKVEKGNAHESAISGSGSYSFYDLVYTNSSYNLNYGSGNYNGNNNVTQSGFFQYSIQLNSDGGFTSEKFMENSEPKIRTMTGRWNFTGSVGSRKDKTQIMLTVSSLIETSKNRHVVVTEYTGDKKNYVYEIRELRNKKMVLTRELSETIELKESHFQESITLVQ